MKKILENKWRQKVCYIPVLAMLLTLVVSCSEKFDEINTPQNQLSTETLDPSLLGQVFARIQYQCIFGFSTYIWNMELYENNWAQYTSNNHTIFQSDQYEMAGVHMDRAWGDFYSRASGPLYYIETYTRENNMPLENAVAKIWRVEAYHNATDTWGPIIYSQAGNGKTSVDYDSQKDIYTDFFKTLDEAVEVLKQNPGKKNIFGNNDQMYQGDGDKWLKFANSLRLRLAMRIVYADPALARQQAEKAVADGVMTTNADNAKVICTVNSINGVASTTYHEEWRMSATLYSVLEGYNDPRMEVYFAPVWNGGPARGLRNGLPVADRDPENYNTFSPIGLAWRPLNAGLWGRAGDNPPMPVLLSAEAYFLRAEGALRGWNMGGTAQELYNEGIRRSISGTINLNTPSDEIEAYINGTSLPVGVNDKYNSPPMTTVPVAYMAGASFETQLEQIITQKWIALFPDGREAWAERRRTGYPRGYALIASLVPELTKFDLPRRKIYPPSEASVNAAALTKAITLLGGPDNGATRVWWDAKPLSDYPTPAN